MRIRSPCYLSRLPRVDVLVNDVGTWPRLGMEDLTPKAWRSLMDVNLTSAYVATLGVPGGAARGTLRGGQHLVGHRLQGHPELVHHLAAKASPIGMTRGLAQALGPDRVRSTRSRPGWSPPTPLTRPGRPSHASFRAIRALPIDLLPRDVVDAVRHLARPQARAVIGQTLVMDAGTVPR